MAITRGLEELADSVVDERTREILRTINESYGPNSVQPITHLDEITTFKKDLGELLGHGMVGIRQIQQELVDLGFLSANIAEYSADIQEKIIDNIFENISSTGLPSYYLSPENPHLEDNRRIIATSQRMKDYLLGLGITHLDDVKSAHAFKKGLMRMYGVNVGNPRQMRRRLAELGTFSANIAEYSADIQEKIIDSIIDEISSTGFISSYLEPKNPYLKDNRRIIATSQRMKDYLLGLGIDHPDVVMAVHAKKGLGTTLGFVEGSPHQMKQRFEEFDMFPQNQNLEQYSPELQVKIIDNIFENMGNDLSSFFLSDYNTSRETNREIVLHSKQLYTYLDRHQIYSLHDIKSEHSGVKGLYKLLGLPEMDNDKLGQMLVDLKLFGSTRERVSGELSKPREDRDSGAILYSLNQYFVSQNKSPILHLDDIYDVHATKSLGDLLGFRDHNSKKMQQQLVAYGIFSASIDDYTPEVQENIIRKIFDNFSNRNFSSYYLDANNPFAESNKRIIAASQETRNYVSGQGITHLDEIRAKHANRPLGRILEFKRTNSKQMQRRFMEFDILSANITDYSEEVRENIITNIITNIPGFHFSSAYLSPENPYTEDNKRLVAASPQMKDYLKSIGIDHLDKVKNNQVSDNIATIFSVGLHNTSKFRQRLVEYGIFSPKLADYTPKMQEEIINHVVGNIPTYSARSYYISPDNPYAEDNRRLIMNSPQMREYLIRKGINKLDDITSHKAAVRLSNLVVFRRYVPGQMKQGLIDLGVFSAETGEYITRPQKLVA